MERHPHVVLSVVRCAREPDVVPTLSRLLVAELLQPLDQAAAAEVASSRGQHLLADEVESDHSGPLGLIEVDGDGVADHVSEFVRGVGLGVDRVPEGAGLEPALGRIGDEEDDLVSHGVSVSTKLRPRQALPTAAGGVR